MQPRHLAVVICAALTVSTAPARAGNLYIASSLQWSDTFNESEVQGEGLGFEFSAGYFFTPRFALELSGLYSDFENPFIDGWLGGFSLNARVSPFPFERLQPYVKGGFGGYFLEEDYSYSGLAGYGFNAGGGIEFFLVPGVSIGGEATWRFIEYTDEYFEDCCGYPVYFDLGQDLDSTTFSFGGTITYHFR